MHKQTANVCKRRKPGTITSSTAFSFDLHYLSFIPDKEMLIPVVDDLDQLISYPLEPEQGRVGMEVGELLMKMRDSVIGQGQICTDSVGPINAKLRWHFSFNCEER